LRYLLLETIGDLLVALHEGGYSKSPMVRLIDSQWHRVLPSITTMYNKLIDLGFTYYNGEVHIVEPEDNENAKK